MTKFFQNFISAIFLAFVVALGHSYVSDKNSASLDSKDCQLQPVLLECCNEVVVVAYTGYTEFHHESAPKSEKNKIGWDFSVAFSLNL